MRDSRKVKLDCERDFVVNISTFLICLVDSLCMQCELIINVETLDGLSALQVVEDKPNI